VKSSIPLLDSAKQREVCVVVAIGGSLHAAARHVGCSFDAIQATAEKDPQFAQQLARAEADFEIVLLHSIQEAGKKSWNAAAWILERVRPDRYGKQDLAAISPRELVKAIEKFAEILMEEVPVEEYRPKILARLEALTAAIDRVANDEARKQLEG
jgi:hypothetical protein